MYLQAVWLLSQVHLFTFYIIYKNLKSQVTADSVVSTVHHQTHGLFRSATLNYEIWESISAKSIRNPKYPCQSFFMWQVLQSLLSLFQYIGIICMGYLHCWLVLVGVVMVTIQLSDISLLELMLVLSQLGSVMGNLYKVYSYPGLCYTFVKA